MKKYIILALGIFLMTPSMYSQTVQRWTEDFDGNANFTVIPSGSWVSDVRYYLPGSSVTNPKSILGLVPSNPGDTTILQTIIYDCTPYDYVLLKFSHICKVSPQDIVRLEYRTDGGGGMGRWEAVPGISYMGKAPNFATSGFNAASYPEWQADDSTILPSQSWWKEESFDLEIEVRYFKVQFRFMIIHGQQRGTQASYGWLIDNFELLAANNALRPPKVEFKGNYPRDTVYTVGPFVVDALVKTSTNVPIFNPWIVYTFTLNGVSTTDSVEMDRIAGDSLWSGTIPQLSLGTSVSYSITGRDGFNNTTIETGWYTIQKPPKTESHGDIIIGTGTGVTTYSPYYSFYDRSWTRAIYYDWEFNPQGAGAYIKSIAYNNSSSGSSTVDRLSMYVKVTKDATITNAIYVDPVTDGATLVWGEATYISTQGWNTFTFQKAFYLPPGYNLMVYWINNDGSYSNNGTTPNWYYTTQSVNNHIRAYQDANPNIPTLSNISLNTLRPNIKASLIATGFPANSVALVEVNSPIPGQTTGGVSAPIEVTLENKGDSVLTSATIKWSVNGGQINTLPWNGNLLWGYKQQISLGSYIPSIGAYDTVLVWVSMPNGLLDSTSHDDSLTIITYGCSPGGMTDVFRIGQTGDFKTLQEAINALKLCASSGGNIVFELESGTYTQAINLTGLSFVGGSLTITSVTHNASDVIIRPSSGVGITFSQSSNIIIKDITVNVVSTVMNAIEFTGACTNIVIRDCRLLASTNTCYGNDNPVYAYVGGLDSIFIINNYMNGGYYGIYIYPAGGVNTNIVIDSNTIQNFCYMGIAIESSVHCISISYNTILSALYSIYAYDWFGIYLYQAHVTNMIGNHIMQRTTDIYMPYGIFYYGQQYAASMSDTALIANNEIIIYSGDNGYGMYVGDGRMKIINNSIYQGSEDSYYESYGLYIEDYSANWMAIRNNNIVMEGEYDYAITCWGYLDAPNYDIDYNNMYAPTYIAYAGNWGPVYDISEWQYAVPEDLNSVSFYPDFVDASTNLELSDYTDFECEKHPAVHMDINKVFRIGNITTMGCYHGMDPLSENATLLDLSGNREGPIQGESDNIKVTLMNTGATTITKATIKWEWNGVLEPDITWTGSLLEGMNVVISLGQVTYLSEGGYTLKVWIDNLDALTDEYPEDDTLFASGYICSASLHGTLTVGTNSADFATLKEFTDKLYVCRADGNIILELQPEIHNGTLNLSSLVSVLGGNMLTVTSSATGNAMNTIIKPETGNAGIILNRSNNVTIRDITVDASAGTSPAIQFTGACTNVLVRDCRLLANPNTSNSESAPVYKADATGVVDNVSFINDTLNGGYYGFYFNGGTGSSSMGKNVVFDSNTVSNQYYYATYPMYVDFTSCSYNTILSRATGTIASTWYGLRMYYSNGPAVGNRIIQRSNSITSPYGIYTYFHNYYSAPNSSLIANNEVILNTTGAYYGIYAYYSKSEILHNSIYIAGNGAARGIYISNSAYNNIVIKNNNIVTTASAAYPVYFSATGNLTLYDMDYNNYYAPSYIGYYGNNITTLPAWQALFTTDLHSVSVLPSFNNVSSNLQVMNYGELLCNKLLSINNDIDGQIRGSLTTMGCYDGLPLRNLNAMLGAITGLKEGHVFGQTDTVKIIVYNTGSTSITSVNLEWSINGVLQNPGGTNYPVSLIAKNQSTTITLGRITYLAGVSEVKVWINNVNGGVDDYRYDDTASKSTLICSGILSGVITVGQSANSNFKTFKQVYDALYLCGVNGDLTIALEPGVYTENCDLSNNAVLLSGYTLTITSTTNKASDVVFRPSSGAGVTFNNSRNIILKDITVDANVSKSYAIQFTAACSNITVRDCRLLADTITTSSTTAPVYKASGTGVVDNIFFINNLLDGGYYGFYFYGGTGSTVYGTNVVFDSNTVSNQYYYATYPYYVDFTSCSYNTILSRRGTTGISSTWYGLRMYYANGPVIGNRIIQRSNSIAYPYGMYLYYHNYYPTATVQGRSPVVNNELILNTTSTYYGIYASYAKSEILHNSIYISGSGAARGIHIVNGTVNNMVIKNNNIVLATSSTTAYPIYFSATGNLTLYDIDYNNYYAQTNIGYYGGARTTLTAWSGQIATDQHSTKVLPQFVNPANSLELSTSNDTLLCPAITGIRRDIQGYLRPPNQTIMGAYIQPLSGLDLMLEQISPWNSEFINNQTISVNVDLLNTGLVPVTSATFGWSINGAEQLPSISWTPTTPLNSRERRNIFVETFQAINADIIDVVVWIKTINGIQDSINWNDTVAATAFRIPLAEFAAPFVSDTIGSLSFDVNVKIREESGAPLNTAEMYIYAEACNSSTLDTIIVPMIQEDDKWVAKIPKRYYNQTVIYETHISDTIGNTVTLRDTTYIEYGIKIDPIVDFSYTGGMQMITLPKGVYELEVWGAEGGGQAWYVPGDLGSGTNLGIGGKGGYSKGTITITQNETVYVYVGGHGYGGYTGTLIPGGFNGGGTAMGSSAAEPGGSGGGASDIRIGSNSLYARTIVAGGGGGGGEEGGDYGGAGGGVAGLQGNIGLGGTQIAPGNVANGGGVGFGQGANIALADGGGGGGGWYGGGRGSATDANGTDNNGGGGGSGWVFTQANDNAGYTSSTYTGGGWLLNSTHYLTNAVTIDGSQTFLSPVGINEIGHAGDGFVRITTISGGGGEVYAGNNLAIFKLVSPENINDGTCAKLFPPVEIDLLNLGENDYDFTKDNITLGYEIINPRGITYRGNISIDTGELLSSESKTIELMSSMAIVPGSYAVRVWVTSAIDNYSCDDTLNTVYISNLMALPVDEDFSGNILSSDFIAIPIIGQDVWMHDTGSLILPPSGETGKLIYAGAYGTMTQLITRQVDLNGVIDPKLEFWYYHDPLLPVTDRSYTNVNIIIDGVVNTVQILFKKDTVQGWKQYTIELKNYTNAQCVLIQFESMNKSELQSAQYLGHITITSKADLAVSEIIISPELTVCEMDSKDLKVVLTTTVNQSIDFTNTGNSLIIDTGSQQPIIYQLSKRIEGLFSDTITVATNIDLKSITNLKAYLSTPVDEYSGNDTAYYVINIQPSLSVTLNPVTTVNSRINMGTKVWQDIVIKNTGNVELSGIELLLRITGTNQDIVRETLPVDLAAGETHTHTFVNSYTVPADERYQVSLIAYLGCDSVNVNAGDGIDEYVDMHNLSIVSIDNPQMGQLDTVNSAVYITVSLANTDDINSFERVAIYAVIENEEGQVLINRLGTIDEVLPSETKQFTFGEPYTVPADSVYRIRVYLGNGDSYPEDDTTEVIRRTVKGDVSVKGIDKANVFTLSQNIPNPANNHTRIDYSIPEAGEVIFHVHSVSGQLLHSKTIETPSGKQSLELNTSTFAAGIYFYSIEYKGQRLVKRMMISD
jgi:hypothetical protein